MPNQDFHLLCKTGMKNVLFLAFSQKEMVTLHQDLAGLINCSLLWVRGNDATYCWLVFYWQSNPCFWVGNNCHSPFYRRNCSLHNSQAADKRLLRRDERQAFPSRNLDGLYLKNYYYSEIWSPGSVRMISLHVTEATVICTVFLTNLN